MDLAVHWVLGRPGVFLNTAGDVRVLPKILDAAARFRERPSDDAMARLARDRQMEPLFARAVAPTAPSTAGTPISRATMAGLDNTLPAPRTERPRGP